MPKQYQPNSSRILFAVFLLLTLLLSPLIHALPDTSQTNPQPQRCAVGLYNGEPTSSSVHSCVCYPGYPNPVRPIKLPNGGKTLYDIQAIIKQGCAKISTYEFGPEPYALEVSETVENTHKDEFGYFGEDVYIGVRFWREAEGQGCSESRKMGTEECEKDFAEAICDQGNGVGYGKCLEYKLYLDPSAHPK